MKLLAASLMLVSFAAIAGEPTAPAAPVDQAAQPEAAAAPAPVAAASTPERKRVCSRETSVGSHIAHTVCRDADEGAGTGAQAIDKLRNDVNRVTPSPQQTSH